MRVLVTGGAGFIGTHLTSLLLDGGHDVLVLDDLRSGVPEPEPRPCLEVCTASLGSAEAQRRIERLSPDAVLHLAALHYIPYTETHPDETVLVNVDGTAWLLELLSATSCRSIVACSSAAVYGFDDEPLDESRPAAPVGVYGRTKAELERLMTEYAAQHPARQVAALRLFNVYGPGDPHPHVVPRVVGQLSSGVRCELGSTWPRRDYVHVRDVADVLLRAAHAPAGLRIVNVGTGIGTSVLELVSLIGSILRTEPSIDVAAGAMRAHDGHLVADTRRMQAAFGPCPTDLRTGMTELLALARTDR